MCKEPPETAENPWHQLDSKDADPMGLPGSGYPSVVQRKRREPPLTSTVLGTKLIELTWTLTHSHLLDGVFAHEQRETLSEEEYIAGTQLDTMAVLVGVFGGQPPVPGPLLVFV